MTFRIAFKALARNKLRTGLTMLGMIIGVAAVIAMVALGTGAQAAIEEQVRSTGTNRITIRSGSFDRGGVRGGGGTSTRLSQADADVLRTLPELEFVAEQASTRSQIIFGSANWNTNVQGTGVDMPAITSWRMRYGEFFTPEDVRAAAKVIVLGHNVALNLFGEGVDPTGEIIRVRNHVFRVLGVMAERGAGSGGQNQDDQVFVPYTTVLKKLSGQQHLNDIIVSAYSADRIDQAVAAITTALMAAHGIPPGEDPDFFVQTLNDIIAFRTAQTSTMTTLLAGVAFVSLVVGGIGIMNIMLVSVTERTREIGLRLAIGARGNDVLLQFLIEAIVISIVGGAMGIAFGYGVSEGVKYYNNWPALVPAQTVVEAVAFSAAVGVFFGFYPARKAANLDPIEALRFE
ncbi:MAG TPA: ABC transporter permease [Vicinamibacterales bacterium]|nr:ABC transporter permease [Vicinamibacterales bacterium]